MAFVQILKLSTGGGREGKDPNKISLYTSKDGKSRLFIIAIGSNIADQAKLRKGDRLDILVDPEARHLRLQLSKTGWTLQCSALHRGDTPSVAPVTLFLHPRLSAQLTESFRFIQIPSSANPILAHEGLIEAVFPIKQ